MTVTQTTFVILYTFVCSLYCIVLGFTLVVIWSPDTNLLTSLTSLLYLSS